MQAKHIVFLDQYGSLGGGQQVLLELVRETRSLGYDATVLLPVGPCADKLRALGATLVPIFSLSFTQGQKTVFDILKLLFWNIAVFICNVRLLTKCDLVYVNGLRLLPVAMLAQRILRRKAACHVHLKHGPKELALIRSFLQHPRTRAVVIPSPFIQRQLVTFDSAFLDARVRLVENGLDGRFANILFIDRFTGKELQHVAIVGRVSPEKGQDVLPNLARQLPNLTFHVMGDTAFSEQSFAERVRDECPANVIWHGWIDDLPAKACELGIQVVIVPSRVAEAAPLVPLQMAALSCLVISRKLGALEDVAKHLEGMVFKQDSEIPLILRKLQQTPMTQLVQQTQHSHSVVDSQFGYAVFCQRLASLIKKL